MTCHGQIGYCQKKNFWEHQLKKINLIEKYFTRKKNSFAKPY